MNAVEIIIKKKNGEILSEEELKYMIEGFTSGDIPDYQMSAFLMAICLKDLNEDETVDFTRIMKDSGDIADLSAIRGMKIDKHSTGGVGDKTTLILSPIAATCGVPIAKMSGRGLGFTGGTIDKLESIPGFRTSIEESEFHKLVNDNGIAVIGQTAHIAPADKKIYALRDVTGTVDNLSLITASIMSKKLASGADGIILDVKCGKGAFMKTEEDALELADMMVRIGRAHGKAMKALITDMDQPLGDAVGNALEVREAISVLKGEGAHDITDLSVNLAGHMIHMGGQAESAEAGISMAQQAIADGRALDKFREFVTGQGGDSSIIDNEDLLPSSTMSIEIKAHEKGFVSGLDAMIIGEASRICGAGRFTKDDVIDFGAGILLNRKIGDAVEKGDVLCTLYGSDETKLENAVECAAEAYEFSSKPVEKPELIRKIVE